MDTTRILLADGHYLVRKGLKSIISNYIDLAVVGEVDKSDTLLEKIEHHKPDVVIIDPRDPYFDLNDVADILKTFHEIEFVVISTDLEKHFMLKVIDIGINCYILKECSEDEIIKAIYACIDGERFFCGKILDYINHRYFFMDIAVYERLQVHQLLIHFGVFTLYSLHQGL